MNRLQVFFITLGCLFAFSIKSLAQEQGSIIDKYSMTSSLAIIVLLSDTKPDELSYKESRCLKTAQWVGAMSGSALGLLHFYWLRAASEPHSPFWKDFATGIPMEQLFLPLAMLHF